MNGVFSQMTDLGHEQVVFCNDKETGLRAVIGIHDTTLGPALGGTRLWPYPSEAEALQDVLRLSRGMTFKAACAGIPLGGGKAVIIGTPEIKSERLFRAYGRFVESLGGRYITAEDVNIAVADMDAVRKETRYVTGVSPELGGSGNPAPVTAYGVYQGMKAAAKELTGSDSLRGLRVAVQGTGSVGEHVARLVHEEGAHLVLADVDAVRLGRVARTYNAEQVTPSQIFSMDVDIFSPCALGAVLDDQTIPQLKARIVAGAANNQLADEVRHSALLAERGVLYCPDYVINAGGLINVYNEIIGYDRDRALAQTRKIFDTTAEVLQRARESGVTTQQASMEIARQRIAAGKGLKNLSTLENSVISRLRGG
jgi:leucine dehydrogenase